MGRGDRGDGGGVVNAREREKKSEWEWDVNGDDGEVIVAFVTLSTKSLSLGGFAKSDFGDDSFSGR